MLNVDKSWDDKIIECYKKALTVARIKFEKNFIDLESLNVLRGLFQKYPHFLTYRFFYAPIFLQRKKLIEKTNRKFILSEYATEGSVSQYAAYMNFLDVNDVDYSLNYIKESFLFIKDFCKKFNIDVKKYFFYKKTEKSQYSFLKHLKARRIAPHVLCFFEDAEEIFLTLSKDEAKYYLNSRVGYFDKKQQLINNKEIKNKILILKNKIL